jgi:hypothetical protein
VPPALVAKTTGYSERQIYRVLAKPAVKAMMIEMARDTVARATPKAAARLTELMAQDDSKKVSLEASTRYRKWVSRKCTIGVEVAVIQHRDDS